MKDFASQTDDGRDILKMIALVREGLSYDFFFNTILHTFSFSLAEWATFLHLSERTLQRYKTDQKDFEPIQSDKILELTMLFRQGISLFGNKQKFEIWMDSVNIALGKIKPKDLLDTSYGIGLLKDEFTRIEHGILA